MATNSQILAAVEAAIIAHATTGVASYTIDGRTVTYESLNDLMTARNNLLAAVQQESTGRFQAARFIRNR
jgi:hypothetical protein